MFRFAFWRLRFNDLISAALILLSISAALQVTQLFSRLDNVIFDVGQQTYITPPPDDILIVAIDENSLSQLGRWPWSRVTHAALIDRLTHGKTAAIGFDVILSEADRHDPLADLALASAMAEAGNVVLPVLLEETTSHGQIIETLPLPSFMAVIPDLGRVHAILDEDSIARSVYLHEGVGVATWQLFAQAVINTALKKTSHNHFIADPSETDANQYQLVRKNQLRVNFLGPPGHFKTISYAQVLNGHYAKGLFENKIVLIGATASGMNDLLTTPVSGSRTPMAGVEFHANVLESIRNNSLITNAPFWLSLLLVLMIAVLPLLWMPKLSALLGFLSTFLFAVLVAFCLGLLPKLFNVWVPPSAALVPLLLAYPIWSWRKLESAQKFLGFELDYLKHHLNNMPIQKTSLSLEGYDKFDARIAQVREATQQLRFLQNDRKETLAFISHDIRAPIAKALMTLQTHEHLSLNLHQPLLEALALSEDFLHTSRAEMVVVDSFNELDFAGLIHQAIDDVYANATKKDMVLQRDMVEGVVWVNGNFGLLHRAVLNLMTNAVKYGHSGSVVDVSLMLNGDKTETILSVTNTGAGIAVDEQATIFKRFARVKGQEKMTKGAGLGLYFVKTVAEKHQGTIQVKSDIGQSTTFSLQLPIVDGQFHEDDKE